MIMGGSGSGKSTLLYALSGLDRPTEGSVELAGQDHTALSEKEASQMRLHQMGFIFQQSYFLDNLSIIDNTSCFPRSKRQGQQIAASQDASMI